METTEILLAASNGRKENICFNAQQVIEKSIKAVLCFLEVPIPLTHNLDILIDRIPKNIPFEGPQNINELTEYATIRRYEESSFELDKEDLNAAFNLAKTTFEWAATICKEDRMKAKREQRNSTGKPCE